MFFALRLMCTNIYKMKKSNANYLFDGRKNFTEMNMYRIIFVDAETKQGISTLFEIWVCIKPWSKMARLSLTCRFPIIKKSHILFCATKTVFALGANCLYWIGQHRTVSEMLGHAGFAKEGAWVMYTAVAIKFLCFTAVLVICSVTLSKYRDETIFFISHKQRTLKGMWRMLRLFWINSRVCFSYVVCFARPSLTFLFC